MCALHPLLSPGTLPKHSSVLREVTEPFVNFPHWLSNVAGHSSLWEYVPSLTFLRPVRGKTQLSYHEKIGAGGEGLASFPVDTALRKLASLWNYPSNLSVKVHSNPEHPQTETSAFN